MFFLSIGLAVSEMPNWLCQLKCIKNNDHKTTQLQPFMNQKWNLLQKVLLFWLGSTPMLLPLNCFKHSQKYFRNALPDSSLASKFD